MKIDITKFKFDNIKLVKLNPYNYKHTSAIKKINTLDVKDGYLWDLRHNLDNNDGDDISYLIKRKNKYVGFFWISGIYSQNVVDCACAIGEIYRGLGIATDVTTKVSDYLLDSDLIHEIELDIDKSNRASKRVAFRAGFRCKSIYPDVMIYS